MTRPTPSLYGAVAIGATAGDFLMRRCFMICAAVLMAAPPRAAAQQKSTAVNLAPSSSVTVQLEGIVLDPMRAPVIGALVEVVLDDNTTRIRTASRERGFFALSLQPGT